MVHIGLVSLLLAATTGNVARRPNVLLVIVDDLRTSIGAYGDRVARTPHFDAFAAASLRFEHAYAQYPVCNPSRISMLTGLRPETFGIFDNRTPYREKIPGALTLPRHFRRAGYHTVKIGKVFHDGPEFDDPEGWDEASVPEGVAGYDKGEGRQILTSLPWCRWVASDAPDDRHPDGQAATEALRVLAQRKAGDPPLFLALGFRRPHDPFIAPRAYFDLYPLDRLTPPAEQRGPAADPLSAISSPNRFPFDDRDRREFMRAYYAGVSFTDAQLGRVLGALDRLGMADDTIVVVTSDHGYHLGERGWWNKDTLFELATRVPLLVRIPGMKSGGRTTQRLVELVDLFPTLTDLAGLQTPPGLAGRSFRPLLAHPERPWKRAATTVVRRGTFLGRTVRTERYRYTEWDGGKRGAELYDHDHDPAERDNLVSDGRHMRTRLALRALLRTPATRAGPKTSAPPAARPPTVQARTLSTAPRTHFRPAASP